MFIYSDTRSTLRTVCYLAALCILAVACGADLGQNSEADSGMVSRLADGSEADQFTANRDDARNHPPAKGADRGATTDSDVIAITQPLLAGRQLNVPVDRRSWGFDFSRKDYWYTVGTRCSAGYRRSASSASSPNPEIIKLSGYGTCDSGGWESPDDMYDCRVRAHAFAEATAGIECQVSVFEEPAPRLDCCSAHAAPRCEDGTVSNPSISACVCARDAYCCNKHWDSYCVAETVRFGCAPEDYCE
jgi:hypothetical protein